MINDPERLQRMPGKELSWRIPGDPQAHATGARLAAAMPGVSDPAALPTKRELLQRQ